MPVIDGLGETIVRRETTPPCRAADIDSSLPLGTSGFGTFGRRSANGELSARILTAVRTNEALRARWDEVDLAKAVWIIPPSRTKARREHRVPLSNDALVILTDLKSSGASKEFVFPGQSGAPLSNMTLLMQMRRMGRDDLTAHGFRSTFRDWCAESGVARDLAEVCLAHVVTNKAEAAYLRSDVLERRRPVMQAWADFCAGQVHGNVTALRAASA